MSESLNRAFLKAYDKEKTSEAKRQASAEERRSREVADLVTHFDTTSVSIPAPHFLKQRTRDGVLAGVTTPAATAQQVAKPIEVKQPVALEVNHEDELRDSIALQMMQAGAWEGQRIDAFIGGFPMLTPNAPPTVQPVSPTRATLIAAHQEISQNVDVARKTPGVELVPMAQSSGSSTGHSVADSGTVASNSMVANSPSTTRVHPPVQPPIATPSSPIFKEMPPVTPTHPPQTQSQSDYVAEQSPMATSEPMDLNRVSEPDAPATQLASMPKSEVEAPSERATVPELQPPQAPALMQSIKPPYVTSVPEQPSAPTTLENHLTQRARSGEIFRLDRPSYAQAVQPVAPNSGTGESGAARGYDAVELDDSSDSYLDVNFTPNSKPQREAELGKSFSSASNSATATATQPVAEPSFVHSRRMQPVVEQTREVEEKLRRARVRIFNPVWEVDSLQWPPVCLQLLERMDSSLQHVADNLMNACQEGLQILAVTSPQRGEGTTTVACCLALLAGSHGLNVAIVDGDIEKPTLSYQTNLDVEQDWRSAILHQLPLEEIAVHSIDDQVTLVPLLNPISHHELSADDDRIKLMMQELSESFDLVILDAGRMDSARSLVTALGERGIISAAVAVVDHRSSTPDRIESCLRRIRQSGISSIGLVENFAA